MKNKILKICLIVLLSIVLLVLIALSVFSIGERILYWNFHIDSKPGFTVPGLWEGFVPQGFDYIDERGVYLTSGYMSNDEASRIYVVDEEGESRHVTLKLEDGSCNFFHCGGLASNGKYVYVTGSGEGYKEDGTPEECIITMYDLVDILDGDGVATAVGSFEVCVKPATLYIKGNELYVGEFHRGESVYHPDESHTMTTPAGDEHHALIAVYNLGTDGKVMDIVPSYAYSVIDQVQGFEFDDQDRMIISTSYGMASSYIYVFNTGNTKSETKEISVREGETAKVPIRFLDSSCLEHEIKAPPMSEEIVYHKDTDRLLIMTESASMKYIFGKITSGNHVYDYDYSNVPEKKGNVDVNPGGDISSKS